MERDRTRIAGFDSLRFFMVVCVIMLHGAMTYMHYVPEWWYVIDDDRNLFFALLVVFLDSFPMSALFFLAGYFAPPSLSKRGASVFMRDKFMHIGIPWIIGVAFVAPFFAHASFTKYGLGEPSVPEFISKWFFGPFYQQGHYWFLGLLFFFFAAYAACASKKGNGKAPGKYPAAMLIAALWFLATLGYYLAAIWIKPAVEWVNICYVLYFQHARFVGYAGLFALGAYGWNAGWFKPGGWSPNLAFWGVLGVLSSAIMLYRQFFLAASLGPQMNLLLEAALYNLAMLSVTFFFAAAFTRQGRPQIAAAQILFPHSYSIYWMHQILLMPFLYFLKPYGIDIYIKWAAGCAFTVAAGFIISKYVLKKAPLLKRIF